MASWVQGMGSSFITKGKDYMHNITTTLFVQLKYMRAEGKIHGCKLL